MKITMEFDRVEAEFTVAMAMGISPKTTKKMTDEELVKAAFRYASTYGFCNLQIIEK